MAKTYGDSTIDYADSGYSYIGGNMADRWWVNDDADNDWNNPNNWSTAEDGAGGAGVPTNADTVKFSDTSSSDNCTLSADSVADSVGVIDTTTGGTDNYTGVISIVTYLLDVTALAEFIYLTIGSSPAGKGLHCQDWDISNAVAGSINLHENSLIEASRHVTGPTVNSAFVTPHKGQLTHTGNGNLSWPNTSNDLWTWIIPVGIDITLIDDARMLSVSSGGEFTLNGTLNLDTYLLQDGVRYDSVWNIGASGDLLGDALSVWLYYISRTSTINNSKTDAFSFEGTIKPNEFIGWKFLMTNWSNANIELRTRASESIAFTVSTLRCKNLRIVNSDSAAQSMPLKFATMYVSGDILIDDLFNFTSGPVGTLYLVGNAGIQTIDFGTSILQPVVIDCAGATKKFSDNAIMDSLTGVAGNVDGSSKILTINGNLDITDIDVLNAFFRIAENGNIQNNNATNYIELTVAATKTATKIGDFYCVECNIETNGTLTGASYLKVFPWISNFLTVASGGSITVGEIEITLVALARSNGAVTLDTNVTLKDSSGLRLTFTGALNLGSNNLTLEANSDLLNQAKLTCDTLTNQGDLRLANSITSDVTNLASTDGLIYSNSAGNIATINLTNSASVTGTAFKDISMGAANKVNAKAATNTNNGGNRGIVFNDKLKVA